MLIADDIMHAAHAAVLDIAVAAVRTCDHDRRHGHATCPTCKQLAAAVDWLDAYRQWERGAAHLRRMAQVLAAEAWAPPGMGR